MNTGANGQEIVWSKVDLQRATADERSLYGAAVRDLRLARGMTQEDLGFAAHVSPRTIRNIERGIVTGQADVLARIFVALDIELSGHGIRASTQQWLAVIGPLLDPLTDAEQAAAMQKVLPVLAVAMRDSGASSRSADVSGSPQDEEPDFDVTNEVKSAYDRAAHRGPRKADQPFAE